MARGRKSIYPRVWKAHVFQAVIAPSTISSSLISKYCFRKFYLHGILPQQNLVANPTSLFLIVFDFLKYHSNSFHI
jgi:hypothetical protein